MNEDGIYDLGFGDISSGYGGNVQSSGNIMEYIFNMLKQGGYEGFSTGWGEGGKDPYDWYGETSFGTKGAGKDIQGWQDYLSSPYYQEGGGASERGRGMSERLLSVLNKLNIPGLMQGYGQDVGGVGAEIGSQTNLLKKGFTSVGKGGRYSSLGTGGRLKGGGGRQGYLSDYYGLQEKEREMITGLQTGVEEDINRMMIDYMGLHPSTTG